MLSIAAYIVIALIGVVLWANNLGFDIINLKRDWPVILILKEIFRK
jgi:hypothetical protein